MKVILVPADLGRGIEVVDVQDASGLAGAMGAELIINYTPFYPVFGTCVTTLFDEEAKLTNRPVNERFSLLVPDFGKMLGDVLLVTEKWDPEEECYEFDGFSNAEDGVAEIEAFLSAS